MISADNKKQTGPEGMQVIRNRKNAEMIFINEIKNSKSEVLVASSSLSYLEHLSYLGFLDSLEQAKSNGAEILILCPEVSFHGREDNFEKYSKLLADINKHAHIRNVTGQIKGSILLVDNSRVLSISDEGADALAIYSDNKSLVNNFGSLFEALWMEKEILQGLVKSKNELLKSNKQLEMHDRMQKEFINIAAHELRTPAQPIVGMADLIESQFVDGKETVEISKEDLKVIVRNARRLEKLSSDILSVTRIESRSLHLHKTEFNLSEAISDVVKDAKNRSSSGKGSDKVEINYMPSNARVVADREAISGVVSNLVSNAIKFTDEGLILISESLGSDEVVVTVKDTGAGIDSEIFPRLFTKFATKSKMGTGLGLFISKNIVEAHGGRIWAENNLENGKGGASFSFSLPFKR